VSWQDARNAAERLSAHTAAQEATAARAANVARQHTERLIKPYRDQINAYVDGFIGAYQADHRWKYVRRSARQRRNRWEGVPGLDGCGIDRGHKWPFVDLTVTVLNKSYLFIQPEPAVRWSYVDSACGCMKEYAHQCLLLNSDGNVGAVTPEKLQRAVEAVGVSLVNHMRSIGLAVPD